MWAERFKSVLVEDQPEVVETVAVYIDLNSVRAGLVEDPKEGGRERRTYVNEEDDPLDDILG